jgi:putative ABC transport system permease protein
MMVAVGVVLRAVLPPRLRVGRACLGGAVLTGAAVGCVLAITAALEVVWLRALPFSRADRLVEVYESRQGDAERYPTTWGNLQEWRPDVARLDSVGAYAPADPLLVEAAEPRSFTVDRITASLLPTLGLRPVLGRAFVTSDEMGGSRVAMLSHRTWVAEYGRRKDVVGSVVSMDGLPHTIIGIAPPKLAALLRADVFTLLAAPPDGRGDRIVRVIGRLSQGAGISASAQALSGQVRALQRTAAENDGFDRAVVVPLREVLVGDLVRPVAGLAVVGGILLWVTTLNVIGLRLAGGERYRRAMAVKLALGATRNGLLRESLATVVIAAVISSGTAFVFSQWLLSVVRYLAKHTLLEADLSLRPTVMVLGALVALGISAMAEAYPTWLTLRGDLAQGITHDLAAFRHGARRHVLRGMLVSLQTAVAIVFAVFASTTVAEAWRASRVPYGFVPDDLVCINIKTATGVDDAPGRPSQGQEFVAVADALRRLPGVISTGVTNSFPVTLEPGSVPIKVRDAVLASNERAELEIATPGYVETLRLSLLEGRSFSIGDDRAHPLVVMVNAAFRDRHWPGRPSVGRAVGIATSPWFAVVGVVGDVRPAAEGERTKPKLYLCSLQARSSGEATVVVRTKPGVPVSGRSVQAAIRSINPGQAVGPVRSASHLLAELQKPRLFAAMCLSVLALVATALAFAGSYSVVSSGVARRQRELALRRVLGAGERMLVLRVVSGTTGMTGLGVVAGLWATNVGRRVYGAIVGVPGGDVVPWVGTASAIVIVLMCVAALVPAWRAVNRPLAQTLHAE